MTPSSTSPTAAPSTGPTSPPTGPGPAVRRCDHEPPAAASPPGGPRFAATAVGAAAPRRPDARLLRLPDSRHGPRASAVAADRHVRQVLALAVDVLNRRRPPAAISRFAHPDVLRCWRLLLRTPRRTPVQVWQVRTCLPDPAVVEAAVVCGWDGRAHAMAVRFEHTPATGWQWVVLGLVGGAAG